MLSLSKSKVFAGLNREQKKAVAIIAGPLLVLAGAGTGKTKVITHRIANLVRSGIAPRNILALTFTKKAGAEMRERISNLIGGVAGQMRVSTFHSLALTILRQNHDAAGLPVDFCVDSESVKAEIAQVVLTSPHGQNQYLC